MAVKARRLIDGKGGAPVDDAILLVEGDRILAVGPARDIAVPSGATMWDAGHLTLMPGMIDAHVHIYGSGEPTDTPWHMREVTELPGDTAYKAFLNAKKDLEAGFTTIRDMACRHYIDVSLRNAIDRGDLVGPRIRTCGLGITSTGGHMDRGRWLIPGVILPGPSSIADGPDEARRVTREQLRMDVDLIKINITLSEWVRNRGGLCSPEMTYETIAAVVEVAHSAGRMVGCHCHGGQGVDFAIKAGVDTLEHGRFLTDQQLAQMSIQGIYLCPTLAPEAKAFESGRINFGTPDRNTHWVQKAHAAMYDTVYRAKQAGVKIAMGTDAAMPLVRHGENAYELVHLVKAGLSPMEAIVSATMTAAECVGYAEHVGTLEAGKFADFLLVDGNPLSDISMLQDLARIPYVVKGGQVMAERVDRTL